MEQNETGCQAPPESPKLCANNCGFFGRAATMNLCSKCHKDLVLKQEHAKLAASSIENIVNSSSSTGDIIMEANFTDAAKTLEPISSAKPMSVASPQVSYFAFGTKGEEEKAKDGPKRCTTCKKRVGLTGFNCRCGNMFCSVHRYSDKHDCPYDYRTAGQSAIEKANPVVKAEKLDKI